MSNSRPLTSNSSNDPLRLDEPLSEAQLVHIVKWYEDEVSEPEHAATHDCHVVRAFRELLRLKRPTIETDEQHVCKALFCYECGASVKHTPKAGACPPIDAKLNASIEAVAKVLQEEAASDPTFPVRGVANYAGLAGRIIRAVAGSKEKS